MSAARLKSFRLTARGPEGWESGELRFGQFLTVLHGPNGSGKTPLLKALLWALGYPLELPDDVIARCDTVAVAWEGDNGEVELRRGLTPPGEAFVASSGRVESLGNSERTISARVLEFLQVPPRLLAARNNGTSPVYMSVLAPAFWVDQDLGWRSTYAPLKNKGFVVDQEEEVRRLLLGLPVKRPVVDTRERDAAKRSQRELEERVRARRDALEALLRGGELDDSESVSVLEARKSQLQAQAREAHSGVEAVRASGARFDGPIDAQEESCRALEGRITSLRRHQAQLRKVAEDVGAEADILSLNATAAEAFRAFCSRESGVEGCGLFRNSELSYGRRLLFLKDQSKDLDSSTSALETEIQSLGRRLQEEREALSRLRAEKERGLREGGFGAVISAAETLAQSLAAVELKLARARQLSAEKTELQRLTEKLEQSVQVVDSMKGTVRRASSDALPRVRSFLEGAVRRWLSVLGTKNVPEAVIDDQLRLIFGERPFTEASSHSGSTRTRIVLAFHAAVLETSLEVGGHHPGLLILDAPKQHELASDDLERFVGELRLLSRKFGGAVQVVLSVSDLFVRPEADDEVWVPAFDTQQGPRYLGPEAR